MIDLIVLSLATWRLSSLLVNEDGPALVFGRMRSRIGITYDEYSNPMAHTFMAQLLSCIWCTSIWVAAILFVFWSVAPRLLMLCAMPLAISAGAILIEQATHGDR